MLKESFTDFEKQTISRQIKNISLETIEREMVQLDKIGQNAHNASARCRIGNNVVDYFTFQQRLETKGKYNVNFYEFVVNIDEFKKKKFIQNMLIYYSTVKNKNNTKSEMVVLKEVYNICISAINIIRPLVYMEIYSKYKPTCILDFCAGWGGAVVASSVLHVPTYIGIEINVNLKEPYERMISYLHKTYSTQIEMIFDNALNIDYSLMNYDLVFTSPPYYFIQKYENNVEYISKSDMDAKFYKPIFTKVYKFC